MHHPTFGIAGAGLAGLTTAINLAQAGQPAEIFEAAPDSGWERKGAWDAVENWSTQDDFIDLLEHWKIQRSFEYLPVTNLEIYDPRGECHPISTSRPLLYLVKRGGQPGALEHSLKRQALETGVTIRYSARRSHQDVDVWAVGSRHRGQFLGLGLHFTTHHSDTVKLLFSARHAPKAYAYLFVVDGQGVLSATLTRDFANARIYLERCLEFFHRHDPIEMENVQLISGFGGRAADFWHTTGTPLRVGEAAGFQDYLWGFGIRYALHSGYLAGQSIIQGTDYQQAVRSQIRPLVYSSLLNRAAYDRAGDRAYRFLIEWFTRSPQLVERLRGQYRVTLPRQLFWLLRRFHDSAGAQGGLN